PTINSVTGLPTGWVGASTPINPTVNVSDPGLGVRNVTISPVGMPAIPYVSGAQCPGTKVSPCPPSLAAGFNLSGASFDQGEKEVQISATDPTGKTSSTYSAQMKVDKTPPTIALSGTLTEQGSLGTTRPQYTLKYSATDGTEAAPQSGVASTEIK